MELFDGTCAHVVFYLNKRVRPFGLARITGIKKLYMCVYMFRDKLSFFVVVVLVYCFVFVLLLLFLCQAQQYS